MNEIIDSRVSLVMEYLEQILDDKNALARIDFGKIKEDGMVSLDIYVKNSNGDDFERNFNTNILVKDFDFFSESFLNRITDKFLSSSNVYLSTFFNILGMPGLSLNTYRKFPDCGLMELPFRGFILKNNIGTSVAIRFNIGGERFRDIVSNYDNVVSRYSSKSK